MFSTRAGSVCVRARKKLAFTNSARNYSRIPFVRINWNGGWFDFSWTIGHINSLKWGGGNLQTSMLGYIFIYVQIKHYSGDGRQLSPLKRTMRIPCLVWEALRLLLFIVCTVPASKPSDHTWFEVLEAITLCCNWADNRRFQSKLVL